MAFSPGTDAKVYLNGFDISSYLRSAGTSGTRDMLDKTTLGLNDRAFMGGLKNFSLTGEGFYESSLDAVDQALSEAMEHGADCIVTYLPYGDALGNRGKGVDGDESSYDINAPVDGLVTIALNVQSSRGQEALQVLHPLGAEAATGNGTGLDGTAQSTNGASAYLQVTAMDRTTGDETLDVAVQDSADDVVYVDLINFAQVTARGAQRVAVTGTVDRYVRATHTLAGTTPSATYSLAFSRK